MRPFVPFACLALLAAPTFAATLHGPKATAQALLAQELAFEAKSLKDGAPAAFGAYMDQKDGLSFGGDAPIRGAAAIAADMQKPYARATLAWTPQEVFASTGDMGVVWGVWSFTTPAGKKPVTGRYVTVWHKDAAGAWKALIDIGSADQS